jgi:N-formylmaleamate deformylase
LSEPLLTNARLADLASVPAVSRWVDAGDVTLHVLDYGGAGPACIVVPGITTPAIGWDFVARDLLDVVRLIVLDVRGRGLSGRAASYRTEDYATDVEAIWPALELSGALLLGHSMGARIAAVVAARGQVPLLGTVLVDPPMSGPGRAPYPMPLASFQQQLASARAGTTAEEIAAIWPTWPRAELELRARWLATCDDAAVEETHTAFESEDFFDTWPSVRAPVALVYGSDSPVVTAEGAAEAARTNPEATLTAVDRAGHMIPWDNRSDFVEVFRSLATTMFETKPAKAAST